MAQQCGAPRKGATWDTVDVPSVDEFVKKIAKAGGKVVQKKTTVLGVGYMAYCSDTEANVFGIMEINEDAK